MTINGLLVWLFGLPLWVLIPLALACLWLAGLLPTRRSGPDDGGTSGGMLGGDVGDPGGGD